MPSSAEAWDRRRIIALFAVLAIAATALIVGLALVLVPAITPGSTDALAGATDSASERDRIASAPMLATDRSDLQEANSAPVQNANFIVPASTSIGPAQVATGYPQTPEGTVGQLAALEVAALAGLSTARARDVYAAWSEEPAKATSWSIAQSIQRFHAAAGSRDGDPEVYVSIVPAAAQVKGSVGDAWSVACVLLDIRISFRSDVRFGYGHCSRMVWDGGRWIIAAGKEPWPAPSTWPGSQRAVKAGWRPWVDGGHQ